MKITYVARNFSTENMALIETANSICDEYEAQGFVLTLRQLYYQFVARAIIPNNMQSYKRLGSVVNDGRLAGLIDWNHIEDRTRSLERLSTWESPRDILDTCARSFRFDWWEDQPCRVEIWVEKEALAGIVEPIANEYRVPYLACRGYVSQSEAWRAGRRFSNPTIAGQRGVVLHLGDHDPSGLDMTRDNDARLELFADGERVEIKRLALNIDQVRQYNPPPNPTKITDSRAAAYIQKFGGESWELDALEPRVIADLIRSNIEPLIDRKAWDKSRGRERAARNRLSTLANDWID